MGALNRDKTAHLYRAGKMDFGDTPGVGGDLVDNYELEVYRSFDRGTTNTGISNLADNLEACRHARLRPREEMREVSPLRSARLSASASVEMTGFGFDAIALKPGSSSYEGEAGSVV